MNTITKPLPPLLATCQASETPVTCCHSFMDAEQTPQQVAPHTLIAKFNLGLILTECFEYSDSDIHSQTFADISATFLADSLKPLTDSPQWIQLLLTLIHTQQKTFQQSRWPFVFSMGGVIAVETNSDDSFSQCKAL